jgi:hypothetical protein
MRALIYEVAFHLPTASLRLDDLDMDQFYPTILDRKPARKMPAPPITCPRILKYWLGMLWAVRVSKVI